MFAIYIVYDIGKVIETAENLTDDHSPLLKYKKHRRESNAHNVSIWGPG